MVLAFTGSDLIELGGLPGSPVARVVDQRDGLPLTLAALVAALLTLGLWARDRPQAEDAGALDRELAAARERIAAVEQARRREHEWIVDLREQLHKMQLEHRVFGDDDDVQVTGPANDDGDRRGGEGAALLYTHRYFHEVAAAEAQRAAVQGSPFAVAMFVLPEIDRTNHERSHAAGDAEIKAVAHAVEQAAVQCGGSASRYSGRRLALHAPGAGTEQIESLVERVTASVPQGIVVRATCAVWRDGDSGEDVIRRTHDGLRVLSAG